MRLARAQKELIKEYFSYLGIAVVISLALSPWITHIAPISPWLLIPGGSLLYGTAFFLLGTVRPRIRIRSFVLNLLAHTGLMAVTILVCYILMIWLLIASKYPHAAFTSEAWETIATLVFSPLYLGLEVGGIVGAGLLNFAFQIGRKLGPGVLTNWITGKYYTPREEELVFMFLDMKDSTTLAEKLGAIKFSALVRDFFRDMTVPLQESAGRVSHYIGDEAVIYWKPGDAVKHKGCIAFFKAFEQTIRDRAPYYQTNYGLVPEFKAGLHAGPVVATEVGEIKSEIVFHGDVVNTTARIQSMCNELGHPLLASREIAAKLGLPKGIVMSALGPVHLKGKAEEIELVAIS